MSNNRSSPESPRVMTAAEIARGLTKAQREALATVPPAWGLPPGHNAWPLVQFGDGEDAVLGEDVDFLLRAGMLSVHREEGCGTFLAGDADIPDVEADWQIDITPLGLAIRQHLEANP